MEIGVVSRFEANLAAGEMAGALNVGVNLEVEAAFEFGALSGEFLGVERDVLIAGGAGAYRNKVGHPARAAQRASAGADAAYASGFLAGSDLLHLDAHLEGVGKDLDELAEVHSLIGYVVEDGLVAVALIFDVADLHVEVERFGYLACADHGVVLAGLCLFVFLKIGGFGFAEHALDLGVGLYVGAAHLQGHELAGQGDHADVMAGSRFDGYGVAYGQVDVGRVAVETLAGVFELYFDYVKVCHAAGDVLHPVEAMELSAGAFSVFFFHGADPPLLGEAYGAGLADYGDFDLSGICHFVLDAAGDFR